MELFTWRGHPYTGSEDQPCTVGKVAVAVDPTDHARVVLRGEATLDVADLEHLEHLLAHMVQQIRERIEQEERQPVVMAGFSARWKQMGDSRRGGWTVAQEMVIAEHWGRTSLREIAARVMVQRKAEMHERGGGSMHVLGVRGVIIRAGAMGILTAAETRRYAGAIESNSTWAKYEVA